MSEQDLVGGQVNIDKYMALLASESDLKVKLQQLFLKKKEDEAKLQAEIESLKKQLNSKSSDYQQINKKSKDDLTQIKGIGPKFNTILSDCGITSFEQIAGWKAADIKKIDESLPFKGRIEKDKWVKQAKKLQKTK